MSDQLPQKFDPDLAFGYDQVPAFQDWSDMSLQLDNSDDENSRPGQWKYGNDVIGKPIYLVLIARRMFRTFFARDYDDVKPGEKNIVVCRSHDGYEAFGLGRRPDPGELISGAWKEKVAPQVCVNKETGERICPMAGGEQWLCRPQTQYLCMAHWDDIETWVPAFYSARGMAHRPTDNAFRLAVRKQRMSAKRVDGKMVPQHPTWMWAFTAGSAKPDGNRKGWVPIFNGPNLLTPPDSLIVDAWVKEDGVELFKRDKEDGYQRMLSTGREDEES